jgi:hypothetical protein
MAAGGGSVIMVERHVRDGRVDPKSLAALDSELSQTIDDLANSPHMMQSALDDAMLVVQARVELDPEAAKIETWEAVVAAMQIGDALFATTTASSGTVECRIAREVRTIRCTGPRFYAHVGNWLTAMWCAIVCRDRVRMTRLCRVPLELLRASEVRYDEYAYLWVDCLQAWWLDRPEMTKKLTTVIEMSHPDIATIAPRDQLQYILYQPINLFYNYFQHYIDGFNDAFVEALEYHKAYWTVDEERRDDIEGSLALGPLAMACLAYDAGIELRVESG